MFPTWYLTEVSDTLNYPLRLSPLLNLKKLCGGGGKDKLTYAFSVFFKEINVLILNKKSKCSSLWKKKNVAVLGLHAD